MQQEFHSGSDGRGIVPLYVYDMCIYLFIFN